MNMRNTIRLVAAVCAGLLNSVAAAQSAPRIFAPDSAWRRVWIVGTDSTDGTLVEPRTVVVSNAVVTVLDAGTREVRAFDAQTGAPRFTILPKGSGPGEFKRPAILAAAANGFVIIDHATSRITRFNNTGAFLWTATVQDAVQVDGVCVRDDRHVLLKYGRRSSTFVEIDSTGAQRATATMPWRDRWDPSVDFSFGGKLSPASPDGTCLMTPIFGAQWAVLPAGARSPRLYAYRETGADPVMKSAKKVLERTPSTRLIQTTNTTTTPTIANGVLLRGDTAIVRAWGTKQFTYRILDYFNWRTGKYLFSRKLPFIMLGLAIGDDGTFYGTIIDEKNQALLAFRPERLPASIKGNGRAPTPPPPARRSDTRVPPTPPSSAPPRDSR
jgi:hypothetical protein